MNKTMNRASVLLLCAALTLPAFAVTGCESRGKKPVKEKVTNVYHSETLLSSSYDYNSNDPAHREISDFTGVGEKLIVSGADYDSDWNYTEFSYILDPATGETTDLVMPTLVSEEESRDSRLYFAEDGSCWFSTSIWSWDEETMTSDTDVRLYHAAPDGTVIATASLYDLLGVTDHENTYLYVNNAAAVGDGLAIAMDESAVIVDGALTKAETIKLDDVAYVSTILESGDDLIIAYTDATEWKTHAVKYDAAAHKLGEQLPVTGAVENYIYGAMPSAEYDFVYSTELAVYGYDFATGTSTELLNWINSDIDMSYGRQTYVSPSGIVYTITNDYEDSTSTTELLQLTRIPDDQVVEKYLLSFGMLYMDYELRRDIIKFNRQSDEYRITIRDYSVYDNAENEWQGGLTQFNNDIIGGNVPDIIMLNPTMPYQSYASKGLFADLYPLIDADETLKRSDFYENILDAFSIDGKLYELAPRFSVQTLVGKSSVVGSNDGWTMSEMRDAAKRIGLEGDPFNGELTRDNFLNYICTMTRDQFIDKDTGRCSFDSDEFIAILEYCKQLPEKTIYEDMDWEEDQTEFWRQHEFAYRTDAAMLAQTYLANYSSFWQTQMGQFGEPVSIVGFPNAARNGSGIYAEGEFAISSACPCKEGAWEFLSYYMKKDLDKDGENLYQFSVLREVNEKMRESALAYNEYRYDGDDYGPIVYYGTEEGVVEAPAVVEESSADIGIAVEEPVIGLPNPGYYGDDRVLEDGPTDSMSGRGHWYYWMGDQRFDMGMMTEEAAEHVDRFLESLTQIYREDETMMEIIREESSAFFAGQKSAAEAAKLIQSRVGLYVSENM